MWHGFSEFSALHICQLFKSKSTDLCDIKTVALFQVHGYFIIIIFLLFFIIIIILFFHKITKKTYINLIFFCIDNLAYKKLTWQTSQIYSSEKAVDGLYTDRSPAGNQCAISKPSPTNVTWLVDLGGVRSISEVRIYYRLNVDSSSKFNVRTAVLYQVNTMLEPLYYIEDVHC